MDAPPDLSAKRFLIVDDMPEMMETVIQMLRHFKATQFFRANAAENALAIANQEGNIDCIISDFNMKPRNGLELLSAIRCGLYPRVPRDHVFILLTGHGELEVVKTARALDVNGYIVKPLSIKTLIQTVQRALSKPLVLKPASHYRQVEVIAAPT